MLLKLIICISFVTSCFVKGAKSPKHVIIIMADDLGFNDVSYRGSMEIPTFNIDALAYSGIILNNYRTPALCTPSRSAFMTGKYPHHLGMQHFVVVADEPWGLSPDEKVMPQYFKDAGYVTKMIGKWHLGFFQEDYLPNNRGFDSFFGYLGPYIDYWDYSLLMRGKTYARGYDMRRNFETSRNFTPEYATELFTREAVETITSHDKTKPLFLIVNHLAPHAANEEDPMQAKQEDIDKFSYIANEKRRTLAAMIHQMDMSVGEIMRALKDSSMLDDTVVVFYSDNGGPTYGLHSTAASNYPLRGQKQSPWEGALRCNGIIWSQSLPKSIVRQRMFYVADWLPTLKTLTGANYKISSKIDGIDQSKMLKQNLNLRNEFVNVDDLDGYGSYIYNDLKLVNGTANNGDYDGWLGTNNNLNALDSFTYIQNLADSEAGKALNFGLSSKRIDTIRKASKINCLKEKCKDTCNLLKGPCLFNLADDPCEERNLADTRKATLQFMLKKYEASLKNLVPSRRTPADPRCDPKNFNYTWSPWM